MKDYNDKSVDGVCVFVGIFFYFFSNIFETKNKWFVLNFNEETKKKSQIKEWS